MKEKIKMILCLCLIIAGLPILMTLVFQGDEILLDTDSNEMQHKSCLLYTSPSPRDRG